MTRSGKVPAQVIVVVVVSAEREETGCFPRFPCLASTVPVGETLKSNGRSG